MTERELFVESIPVVAEMAVTLRRTGWAGYAEWKEEAVASAPPSARGFVGRILTVLDTVARQWGAPEEAFLQEEGEAGL